MGAHPRETQGSLGPRVPVGPLGSKRDARVSGAQAAVQEIRQGTLENVRRLSHCSWTVMGACLKWVAYLTLGAWMT